MIIRSIGEIVEGRKLHQIAPDATVRSACDVLNSTNVGALPVMDGAALVGVLSERDVIRRAIGGGKRTTQTSVREIMTPDPATVETSASLSDAMRIMLRGRFRHLPVREGDEIVAMLSMRDIPTEYRLMVERYEEYTSDDPRHLQPAT